MLGNTTASNNSTFEKKLGFFVVPFLVTTGRFLFLAKVFRNNQVAACSTARRSATEKNEKGSYVTIPSLSKMTQHNQTADWLKFY